MDCRLQFRTKESEFKATYIFVQKLLRIKVVLYNVTIYVHPSNYTRFSANNAILTNEERKEFSMCYVEQHCRLSWGNVM